MSGDSGPDVAETPGPASAPVILSTYRFSHRSITRLAVGNALRYGADLDELIASASAVRERVSVLAVGPITPAVKDHHLAALPRLGLIAVYGVGYDHVDVIAAHRRQVSVTNTVIAETPTVEVAIGLMIGVARRLREGDALIRAGAWPALDMSEMVGTGLSGKQLGLIGLGRIGRGVARVARSLGMRLVYTQRRRASRSMEDALGATYLPLAALLRTSDIVSIHCPLTAETRHLIDAAALSLMKTTAILVNTSRGGIVDTTALESALGAGQLAGAGLDVFEDEPVVAPALMTMPNVFLTPHLGGATSTSREAMAEVLVEQILDFRAGLLPTSLVGDARVAAAGDAVARSSNA